MKKIYFLVLIFIAISCSKDEEPQLLDSKNILYNESPTVSEINYIDLTNELNQNIKRKSQDINLNHEMFGYINDKKLIKKYNDNEITTYTIALSYDSKKIISNENYFFDNLVIKIGEDNLISKHIIRYQPSRHWLEGDREFKNFSGNISFFDLQGKSINSIDINNISSKKLSSQVNKAVCNLKLDDIEFICTSGHCEYTYVYKMSCTIGGSSPGSPSGDGPGGGGPGSGPQDPDSIPSIPIGGGDGYEDPWEEPDFEEEEFNVSFEIETSNLDSCLKSILNKIQDNNHNHGIGDVLMTFADSNSNLNWKTMSGTLNGGTGETSTSYDTQNNIATTTFDSNTYTNGTDLSWVRTILHEVAHAYVVSISNMQSLSSSERQELLGENWLIAYANQGHDFIAETYINSIADILQEYGNYEGYNLNRQFYEDLAWGGLQNTSAFNSLPSSDQNRILDVIAVELTGIDTNDQNQNQNGNNAGC